MQTKRAADRLAFIFLTTMLLLTLFAKDIYRQTFPKVVGERLQKKDFPITITLEDGTEIRTAAPRNAVPVQLLKENELWVLAESETQGIYVLEAVNVELGTVSEGYAEVISGISARQLVFLGSDREAVPGDRVMLAAGKGREPALSETACAVIPKEAVLDGSVSEDAPAGSSVFPSFAVVRETEEEYRLYAPAGLESVVYYEVQRRLPADSVSSPWLEGMRQQNAAVLGITSAITILLAAGGIALRKRRFFWLRACLFGGWLVTAGFLLKRFLIAAAG